MIYQCIFYWQFLQILLFFSTNSRLYRIKHLYTLFNYDIYKKINELIQFYIERLNILILGEHNI